MSLRLNVLIDKIFGWWFCLLLTKTDVIASVREQLENKGYTVSYSVGKYGLSAEILAKRDKDTFLIEAIEETSSQSGQNIVFAIGKIVKRMKEQ